MSALAEALLAAQRQAVAGLAKAFVAGAVSPEAFLTTLDEIGLRDTIEQGLLLASLGVVKQIGGEAPAVTGQVAPKMPDPPTDAQRKYIAKLCDERNLVAPDVISTKDEASEIIEKLKDGTVWTDDDGLEWAQHVAAETERWSR